MEPKCLYRSESYSGSGCRDLAEIIAFEVGELNNIDILVGIMAQYELTPTLREQTEEICRSLVFSFGLENLDLGMHGLKNYARQLISSVEKETGQSLKYGLWLAPRDVVADRYASIGDEISVYPVSETIFSNLGYEQGALFAYSDLPEPIAVNNLDAYREYDFRNEDFFIREKELMDRMFTLYHVTYAESVPSILKDGLLPSIGSRSAEAGEESEAVYLFSSLSDVEGALSNWLGDALCDDGKRLSVLAVSSSAALSGEFSFDYVPSQFEVKCYDSIPAEFVRLVDERDLPFILNEDCSQNRKGPVSSR